MLIIGCDLQTRYQQIAMVDTVTGELTERRLDHESGEAHDFYRSLQGPVRVGGWRTLWGWFSKGAEAFCPSLNFIPLSRRFRTT
jgi:hypothetical protein